MSENTRSSALAAVFDRLDHLTELELRQVYLAIGVRLGDAPAAKPVPRGGKSSRGAKRGRGGTTASSAKGGKGNPQRKSQWANHPLYQEYSRLKKSVEAQAKEAKRPFNSIDTAESRAYRVALSQWLGAKSSFRDHPQVTEETSDEESEVEGEKTPSRKQPGVSPGRAEPVSTGSAASPQGIPGSSAGRKPSERASGKLPEARKTPSPPNSGGKAGSVK